MSADNTQDTPPVPEQAAIAIPAVTPEQIAHAAQVAENLDPDLQAAVNSGNTAVIAAIASGATTTPQIVDSMIRMGIPPSQCPPGVAQMVDARLKEFEAEREREADARAKTAAGLAAVIAGTMAANSALAAEGRATNGPSGGTITEAERKQWSLLSGAEWADMFEKYHFTDPNRASAMAQDKVDQIDENNKPNIDKMTELIKAHATDDKLMANLNKDEPDPSFTPEQLAVWKRYKELMKPMLQAGNDRAPLVQYISLQQQIADEKDPAKKAQLQAEADRLQKQLSDQTHDHNKDFSAAKTADQSDDISAKVDETVAKVGAATPTDQKLGDLKAASTENLAIGAGRDAVTAKAEVKAGLADSGFDGDEPAPTKVAAAEVAPATDAQRLTVKADHLGKVQLAADSGSYQPVTVAANDPAPQATPEAEPNKPRMAATGPASGMG